MSARSFARLNLLWPSDLADPPTPNQPTQPAPEPPDGEQPAALLVAAVTQFAVRAADGEPFSGVDYTYDPHSGLLDIGVAEALSGVEHFRPILAAARALNLPYLAWDEPCAGEWEGSVVWWTSDLDDEQERTAVGGLPVVTSLEFTVLRRDFAPDTLIAALDALFAQPELTLLPRPRLCATTPT